MYSMIRSSISLECGMLSPPVVAAPRNASTALDSTRVILRATRAFFLAAFLARRHGWHRGSNSASLPARKYSSVLGNVPPQSMHTFSGAGCGVSFAGFWLRFLIG